MTNTINATHANNNCSNSPKFARMFVTLVFAYVHNSLKLVLKQHEN